MDKGSFGIQQHGIISTKKEKKFKCSVCKWATVSGIQLTRHVKEQHPYFKFKCKYCPKDYVTFSSKYKHEKKHTCKYCDRGFFFQQNLINHEKLHTETAMILCTNCSKSFPTKWLMSHHQAMHQNQKCTCDQCLCMCNTLANLKQHKQGAHCAELVATCGQTFLWPKKRNSHQKSSQNVRTKKLKSTLKKQSSWLKLSRK